MLTRALGTAVTVIIIVAAVSLAAWFAFATLTGATLITFRTGSMAPTMPQGAVGVALPVSAAEIAVGDVVTVQRAGEPLPVTHRVVEVRDATTATSDAPLPRGGRELVLQGDDNAQPDLLPYVVTHAKRVVVAAPGLGHTLMLLQSPIGMGAMTVVAGALATWAFWPKPTASSNPADGEPAAGSTAAIGPKHAAAAAPADPDAVQVGPAGALAHAPDDPAALEHA